MIFEHCFVFWCFFCLLFVRFVRNTDKILQIFFSIFSFFFKKHTDERLLTWAFDAHETPNEAG